MTDSTVLPPKPDALEELFTESKPIIGVIHLAPLPGAPRYDGATVDSIYEAAVEDARRLVDGGIDGIIVENAFDLPFSRPEDLGLETVASLAVATRDVSKAVPTPLGITCVANAVEAGLAVAKAAGAGWVRANQWANAYVANEGLINGPAGAAMRYRSNIGARDVRIFADVHVKFGSHSITADRDIEEQTRDLEFFDADAVIVTGSRTGSPTDVGDVERVKGATTLPVLVGSGMTTDDAPALLEVADGAIVGAGLKENGQWWRPVDPARVAALVNIAAKHR